MMPTPKINEKGRVSSKKPFPLLARERKVVARPIATKVSTIRLSNGALFILPHKTSQRNYLFF
jgi:hypothetical protein